MNDHFKLQILTPHRSFFNDDVINLKLEDSKGHLEILPNHMHLITVTKPSSAEFTNTEGCIYSAFISEGIMKIRCNTVTILCKAAEWPEEIDSERAEKARKRAEERLKINMGIDILRAENSLLRAIMRLKTKKQ